MKLEKRIRRVKEALLNPFDSERILKEFSELEKALALSKKEEILALKGELEFLKKLFQHNKSLVEGFMKVGEKHV